MVKNLASVKSDKELETLSKDKSWVIRQRVAENHNAPIHVLENLSKDDNDYVRETATSTLEKL